MELEILMAENEEIIIIDADLAKAAGHKNLMSKFPERCINVGVAEQNMAGIAAGMASYGFIPLIFTFAPFATRRICDQVAVSSCYARQNIKIFGMDPGISAESNGGTHMSFEDVGVMRSIPEIIIFEPCDEIQLAASLRDVIFCKKTVYVRLLRKESTKIFNSNYKFDLLKADVLSKGSDISIFCSGIMIEESLCAAKILAKQSISAEVIGIHTIKPIDSETIIKSLQKTGRAVTAENHNIFGGLHSAVCEVVCKFCPTLIFAIGVEDEFGQVGKMSQLKAHYKMRAEDIVKKCWNLCHEKKA
jgi:transketolase